MPRGRLSVTRSTSLLVVVGCAMPRAFLLVTSTVFVRLACASVYSSPCWLLYWRADWSEGSPEGSPAYWSAYRSAYWSGLWLAHWLAYWLAYWLGCLSDAGPAFCVVVLYASACSSAYWS